MICMYKLFDEIFLKALLFVRHKLVFLYFYLGNILYILVTSYNILCMALYSMVVMCSNPVGGTSQYLYGFFLRVFLTTGERLK